MSDKQACEPGTCAEGTPLTCEGYGCAKESKTIPEIRQSLPCADCGGETRHAESCPIPAIGTIQQRALRAIYREAIGEPGDFAERILKLAEEGIDAGPRDLIPSDVPSQNNSPPTRRTREALLAEFEAWVRHSGRGHYEGRPFAWAAWLEASKFAETPCHRQSGDCHAARTSQEADREAGR